MIQSDELVVAVEIEMVIPDEDPSETCLETETVDLLSEIKEQADRGDVAWFQRHEKVYAAMTTNSLIVR